METIRNGDLHMRRVSAEHTACGAEDGIAVFPHAFMTHRLRKGQERCPKCEGIFDSAERAGVQERLGKALAKKIKLALNGNIGAGPKLLTDVRAYMRAFGPNALAAFRISMKMVARCEALHKEQFPYLYKRRGYKRYRA